MLKAQSRRNRPRSIAAVPIAREQSSPYQGLPIDPRLAFGVTVQLLLAFGSDGCDQSTAHPELLEESRRHRVRSGRQQNPIEWRAGGPTDIAIVMAKIHIAN